MIEVMNVPIINTVNKFWLGYFNVCRAELLGNLGMTLVSGTIEIGAGIKYFTLALCIHDPWTTSTMQGSGSST